MTGKLDEMFTRAVGAMRGLERTAVGPPEGAEGARRLLEVCDAQLGSRHLDLAAQWLQVHGRGYYPIGSSATRATQPWPRHCTTDPALLHYRSGAFFLERARKGRVTTALWDVLLWIIAATEDPISGGRHEVFGSRSLAVIPQTSTIASHLAWAGRSGLLDPPGPQDGRNLRVASDAVTICSFGDASADHSTATGADLRWLVPLPAEDILREAQVTGRALVVDETRR